MKFLMSLILMMGLYSCSGSKSTEEINQDEAGIELADTEEFLEDESEESIEDTVAQNVGEEVASEEISAAVEIAGGQEEIYTVQKNETLMMISFKIYGDYSKWKELASINEESLKGSTSLNEGMNIKYITPETVFAWNPEGNKYLIKNGDTLGTISNDTYGTQKYWKDIWKNNEVLIQDPNRIFAGFTIYTPLIDGRDIAYTK